MVGIIVGDRLPVERPRPKRHPPHHPQVLEAVRRDFGCVGRHHLRDRGCAGFERHEQEAAPILERNGFEAELLRLKLRIFLPMRHANQPPVPRVAPGVIGAGQHLGAATGAVEETRPSVAADVGESPHRAIVAADDDHALAEILQRTPVAPLANLALVAHDLRRRAEERLLLGFEIFRVEIQPAGEAHQVEWVLARRDVLQLRGHGPVLP